MAIMQEFQITLNIIDKEHVVLIIQEVYKIH